MELGKVDENYASLRALILKEQFLTVSNKNLVLFLKERKVKSIEEMVELADQYNEAHSVNDVTVKQSLVNRTDNRTDLVRKDASKTHSADENKQSSLENVIAMDADKRIIL